MKKIKEFENFLSLPLVIRTKLVVLGSGNHLKEIRKEKADQLVRFTSLKRKFQRLYKGLSRLSLKKFVTPTWNDFNSKMESVLLPEPPDNFLTNPLIMYSMVMTKGGSLLEKQLKYIERVFGQKRLREVLKEDLVGGPLVINKKYLTSHNRIHQLYHLARYEQETKKNISDNKIIAEWGGGYGNMAAVIKRLVKKPVTYILIDTPIFLCLQWLYLASIFGPEIVNLITKASQKIEKNKINLIPVQLLNEKSFRSDLFITNWALSESSKYSQDLVERKAWFGAKNLLIGYQQKCDAFAQAENVGRMAEEVGGFTEEIDLLPSNYYAFK